ncbi:Rhamnogalacturonan endolyase YesW [Paramyrothecium foliicola]|nr:Rhamnogalacturonan endolyase YesW [Paramyrothecium foliicola]
MKFLGKAFAAVVAATACLTPSVCGQRVMENLRRGVVAVRSSNTDVLISWRLLGLDPDNIAFNLYRAAGSGSPVKLNSAALTGGTNFVDTTANLAQANTYTVRPVLNGQEQAVGGTFTLKANNPTEPVVRIPIRGGGPIKFVWVGDLDGDGEYDFVLDRQTSPQLLEAYRSDGTFLWQVNMGPNSQQQDNIEPGSSANNLGHWDGVTVYDFDSDGRAEVAVRIANGVTFGNGQKFTHGNNNEQFIAILDGRTGALRARAQIPTDYISDGPLAARFGVGYLDGQKPSLVTYFKNRKDDGAFNLLMAAWSFSGNALTMQWKWRRENQDAPDGHNTRVVDVDGDGKDEIHEIGFTLNGDGKVRYLLGPQGVVHGDRFHIAKMDPNRAGLQGYAVQQDNPSGLLEYYYDATKGTILWKHTASTPGDVGRGMVGDIDPSRPGMEVWSFSGLYNGASNQKIADEAPWPHLGLFWDGDTLMELFNDGKIEKWNPASAGVSRLVTTWNFGAQNTHGPNPAFHGDILGDWREEVILVSPENDELVIFTTNQPSTTRLYTLPHNPAYRNSMTLKGYVQSHHVDYFIGQNMSKPPRPNIRYAGSSNPATSQTSSGSSTPTNPPSGGQAYRYEQCGGSGWTGPTACAAPWTCQAQNEWYSQCL